MSTRSFQSQQANKHEISPNRFNLPKADLTKRPPELGFSLERHLPAQAPFLVEKLFLAESLLQFVVVVRKRQSVLQPGGASERLLRDDQELSPNFGDGRS